MILIRSRWLLCVILNVQLVVISCQDHLRYACLETFALNYRSKTGSATIDCGYGFTANTNVQTARASGCAPRHTFDDERYCISNWPRPNVDCDGNLCLVRIRIHVGYRDRDCNNRIELQCRRDPNVHATSICRFSELILKPNLPTYLSLTPIDNYHQGCKIMVNRPSEQSRMLVSVVPGTFDTTLRLKLCQESDVAVLYILKNEAFYTGEGEEGCRFGGEEMHPNTPPFDLATSLLIIFQDVLHTDTSHLLLQITAKYLTTTTRSTTRLTTSGTEIEGDAAARKDDGGGDSNAPIIIALTVVICAAIIGVAIFVAVYICRNPESKEKIFRVSRNLRRRPRVERNVYGAAHSGLRPSDMQPPDFPAPAPPSPRVELSAPRLSTVESTAARVASVRNAERTIIGMRLPAIPPRLDTEYVELGTAHLARQSRDMMLESVPDVAVASQATEPTTKVRLPLPVPSAESDDSDDDREYIPDHRFNMVREQSEEVPEQSEETDTEPTEGSSIPPSEQTLYANTSAELTAPEGATSGAKTGSTEVQEKPPLEHENVDLDNATGDEDKNPTVYENLNK